MIADFANVVREVPPQRKLGDPQEEIVTEIRMGRTYDHANSKLTLPTKQTFNPEWLKAIEIQDMRAGQSLRYLADRLTLLQAGYLDESRKRVMIDMPTLAAIRATVQRLLDSIQNNYPQEKEVHVFVNPTNTEFLGIRDDKAVPVANLILRVINRGRDNFAHASIVESFVISSSSSFSVPHPMEIRVNLEYKPVLLEKVNVFFKKVSEEKPYLSRVIRTYLSDILYQEDSQKYFSDLIAYIKKCRKSESVVVKGKKDEWEEIVNTLNDLKSEQDESELKRYARLWRESTLTVYI